MMGGGGPIPMTVASADRPHSHSQISFSHTNIFWREQSGRVPTAKSKPTQNDCCIQGL